jgi:putative membrane protein
MRRAGLLRTAIAAIILASWGCSKAESTKTPATERAAGSPPAVGTGGAGANLSDSEFVRDVALKNLAAVELSRMALGKAVDPEVKAFAQTMVDDHESAANGLRSAVAGQPIEWPAQLDEKHRKPAEELTGKHGADFDREYLKAMIEGQQDLAAKLESRLDVQSVADWKTAAAARAQGNAMPDPKTAMRDVTVRPAAGGDGPAMKINRWAADTYPMAQKHLDTTRTLEKTIKKRSTD